MKDANTMYYKFFAGGIYSDTIGHNSGGYWVLYVSRLYCTLRSTKLVYHVLS